METEKWVLDIVISICIAAIVKSVYDFIFPNQKLPPGPTTVPLISSLLWHLKSPSELEPTLRKLHAKHGPIVTLQIGSRRTVFISDNSLTYKALVKNSVVFADRPEPLPTFKDFSANQLYMSLSSYGPTWRLLRRNISAEILHPSRLKSYSHARRWVCEMLTSRLQARSKSVHEAGIRVLDLFQSAMFSLLVLMCFGDKLEEKQIQEIETIQRKLLLGLPRFNIMNYLPKVAKLLFRRRLKEFYQLRKNKEDVLLPHIRARQQLIKEIQSESGSSSSSSSKKYVLSYVDTLLDLELPEEEMRKLNDAEMVSLCSEFLDGGTDTTTITLQWIMARLTKHPQIQDKLFQGISGVVGEGKDVVVEEDLEKMPYLKALVLEGLRRHPPSHFLSPRRVTQDVAFEGYVIPKNTCVNFLASEMNWNPKIWEDPMEFKPERFLSRNGNGDEVCDFDITGSREIKMVTFGAGRRMCPGFGLAMLHLEYFVANLVWSFEWKAAEGDHEVDLSEKEEVTVVMKNPLRVHLIPRRK